MKNFLLFFFTAYMNGWKQHKFRQQKIKICEFYKNKEIFNTDGIDVDKYWSVKKYHIAKIIHLNTLLDIMVMILLDHYL